MEIDAWMCAARIMWGLKSGKININKIKDFLYTKKIISIIIIIIIIQMYIYQYGVPI